MCYLSRDASKELEFKLDISDKQELQFSEPKIIERYRITNSNTNDVLKDITHLSFGEIIKYILDYDNISVQDLEIESGVSERMIRRYIKGEIKDPTIKSVVAILRALDLPPKITEVAINQAGIKFRYGHETDDALFAILTIMRKCSLKQCNDFLHTLGLSPLTNEE